MGGSTTIVASAEAAVHASSRVSRSTPFSTTTANGTYLQRHSTGISNTAVSCPTTIICRNNTECTTLAVASLFSTQYYYSICHGQFERGMGYLVTQTT